MIRAYPARKLEYEELHKQSMAIDMSGMPRGGGGTSRTLENLAIRELPATKQREYEAVRRAITATERMKSSRDRLKVIDLVFWKQTHTLEGAAMMIPCSYDTAQNYHEQFIHLVAELYGLKDV